MCLFFLYVMQKSFVCEQFYDIFAICFLSFRNDKK